MLDLKDSIQFCSVAVQNVKGRSELRRPLPRQYRPDITNPTFGHLLEFALVRLHHVVVDDEGPDGPPPLLFPSAESTRATWFREADWNEIGDLETELGRLTWTITNIPERAFPITCRPLIEELLAHESVLSGWDSVELPLKKQTNLAAWKVVQQMQVVSQLPPAHERSRKEHFLTIPLDYEAGDPRSELSLFLWYRILIEGAVQAFRGRFTHAKQFLQIHTFLKDPICGLRRDFDRQVSIFQHLIDTIRADYGSHLNVSDWRRIIAQAALESSYLALPQMQNVEYIHFSGHQQLPYLYITIDSLARAEFTESAHVLDLVEELLLGEWSEIDKCPKVPPILVAPCPRLRSAGEPLTVIIDGNHRATAIILLRFLATLESLESLGERSMDDVGKCFSTYCETHQLGAKWKVDLMHVLELLTSPEGASCVQLLADKVNLVREFSQRQQVPALVVQKENFHTICKQRTSPRLYGPNVKWLLPMHQSVFNDDELGFGLPERDSQAHGRPLGYKPMPLRKG